MVTSTAKASRTVRGSASKPATSPSPAPAAARASSRAVRKAEVGAISPARSKPAKKRAAGAAKPAAASPVSSQGATDKRYYLTIEGKTVVAHLGEASRPASKTLSKSILSLLLRLKKQSLGPQPVKRQIVLTGKDQAAGSVPLEAAKYPPSFSSQEVKEARMKRHYFRDQKRWGYILEHAKQEVGHLLFDDKNVWALYPTSKVLDRAGMEPSIHRNPVGAFVRLTTTWHEALSSTPKRRAA